MPPDKGFHITWSKAAVIFAAIGVLQAAGMFMSHPKASEREASIIRVEQKLDDVARRLDAIETCLLERRCGGR